jgi:hypothetical protein
MPAARPAPTRRLAPACAALALFAAGCGAGNEPKTYPVSGKVVYKGKGDAAQLEGGYVILEAVADPAKAVVQGQIDEGGTFALGSVIGGKPVGGVLPGEYRVRVVPPTDEETGRAMRTLIHPRFQSFDKSGIRLTIAADENDVTIEVEPAR